MESKKGWIGVRVGLPMVVLLAVMAAWLWPIGVGGRMPVGGDVTQFQIGLMAVLSRALRAGRLPLWNDLWGYGFPGVGESQMGAFYPPHRLLYGLLSTEAAYTASLVIHTAWGACGAAWAARRFGVSPWGSTLAGLSWSASGFFVIHLSHQWGYTVGSWMPWAWGLAWPIARGGGGRRDVLTLAVVLSVQTLPGHFQLAFTTQVALLGMGLWAFTERLPGRRAAGRGTLAIVAAMAMVVPLAAMQLGPTWRLARMAGSRRDFEYLSGFASTPLHLVNYLAPGLFHGSPLWRPVAWDPFHTAPEEHLAYVGLAPLFLALVVMRRGFRDDPAVRLMTVLALASLILSLGPYVPGFTLWSRLPGFSFFRCPARWSLTTALALAILAGKGFDGLPQWPRPGKALVDFVGLSIGAVLLIVLGFELALASTQGRGWPAVAGACDWGLRRLPWSDVPSFSELMATARRPQSDSRVLAGLAHEGYRFFPAAGLRLDRERFGIYWREGQGSGLVFLALLVLAPFARHRRIARVALIAITAADLWHVGRYRGVDDGPIRPLVEQSPVLARLAAGPRGERLIAGIGNLPMIVRAAPVEYYRTLDLPAVPLLARWADGPLSPDESGARVADAMRATGATVRLIDPYESARLANRRWPAGGTTERIDDPALASWSLGAAWARAQWARSTYLLWMPNIPTSRAWLVPDSTALDVPDPGHVLTLIKRADPLTTRAPDPEHREVEVKAGGPGIVVLSVLFDPEWRARWIGPKRERPAEVVRAFGGWQAIRVPGAGTWTLHLEYRGRDVKAGLAVSAAAWLTALGAWIRLGREEAKA